MKKKFPKKAKLMTSGGFYRILPIKEFFRIINFPIMRRIKINQPELDWGETLHFNLIFEFQRVYKGYAEYRQVNEIKIDSPQTVDKLP